jgi:hypothetical protein
MNSFWQIAERYPPCLVRLLARHRGGPPLLTHEIAERSGLSPYQIASISQSVSWDSIPFGYMRAFLKACDIDFCSRASMNRKAVYLKTRNKFHYLRKSPEWASVLRPLVIRFREETKSKLKQP